MTIGFDDFTGRVRPYRSELLAHCYRMLASIHDAEDAVQETLLRAWRSYDGFEERSSIRTWLHRIATNCCLRAVENRGRRAMPTGLGGPAADPAADLAAWPELPWAEPAPDGALGVLGDEARDPAVAVTRRDSVRLAFIVALQMLPPRQRAVLLLRDVLVFSAADVAAMLETSPQAVNSLLQRARTRIAQEAPTEDEVGEVEPGTEREILERFETAMRANDIPGLVAVLTEDAVYEMPPYPEWFRGAAEIGAMVDAQSPAQGPGDHHLVPVAANGQPAFALYMPDEHGVHRAFNLQVLTVTPTGVAHVVAFFDPRLFARFGLPETATPPR
ncbi:sigma-70 family RNA polymerase sigma factor [Brachybacterium sp. YJGR34]|uniref:sigma-70 family RNA polymerase sigma factor n=1 Tax=Brachybacterium sp. YJGR34 TaxID=2059911 RepID=UPI000E0BFC49|nr:sigma-70 family RNA polymerase sigma factor [Brachybacterium sp. YJGR34]